jgi:hypothetical protein
MKTKISTTLAICVLGITGLINIHAVADNKKVVNAEVNTTNTELLNNETILAEELFIQSAEELTSKEAEAEIEKYATKQVLLSDNLRSISEFPNSAEMITVSGADQEIEKYARKQVFLQLTRTEK